MNSYHLQTFSEFPFLCCCHAWHKEVRQLVFSNSLWGASLASVVRLMSCSEEMVEF